MDALDALKNYKKIAIKVKEIIKMFDANAKVYVFGSVVKGRFTGASDIDILVVTEKIDVRHEIIVEVYRQIKAPIELHVVTQKQFKNWYLRFINPQELEEI